MLPYAHHEMACVGNGPRALKVRLPGRTRGQGLIVAKEVRCRALSVHDEQANVMD